MKKTIIISMLMLGGMSSWAQAPQSQAKDPVCVFDGTVTNVPDGSKIIALLYASILVLA